MVGRTCTGPAAGLSLQPRATRRQQARQLQPNAAGVTQPWGPRGGTAECQAASAGRFRCEGLPCGRDASQEECTTSGRGVTGAAAAVSLAAALGTLLAGGAAHAGESAPAGFLEFVLTTVEGLGPLGPAAFIVAVSICECVPLFPTQPLSLASGVLFGTQKGALCMLIGTTVAATLAFSIARGVGRPLAERLLHKEVGEEGGGEAAGALAVALGKVQAAVDAGSFWQQAGAIFVLRMVPFLPFSASNYALGMSTLPLAPYLSGTVAAMAFWSFFYAGIGGTSRAVLHDGVSPDLLLADLLERAGSASEALVALPAVAALGVALAVWWRLKSQQPPTPDDAAAFEGSASDQEQFTSVGGPASSQELVEQ